MSQFSGESLSVYLIAQTLNVGIILPSSLYPLLLQPCQLFSQNPSQMGSFLPFCTRACVIFWCECCNDFFLVSAFLFMLFPVLPSHGPRMTLNALVLLQVTHHSWCWKSEVFQLVYNLWFNTWLPLIPHFLPILYASAVLSSLKHQEP